VPHIKQLNSPDKFQIAVYLLLRFYIFNSQDYESNILAISDTVLSLLRKNQILKQNRDPSTLKSLLENNSQLFNELLSLNLRYDDKEDIAGKQCIRQNVNAIERVLSDYPKTRIPSCEEVRIAPPKRSNQPEEKPYVGIQIYMLRETLERRKEDLKEQLTVDVKKAMMQSGSRVYGVALYQNEGNKEGIVVGMLRAQK